MKKIGVIIARFQPIHNGHMAIIRKALEENNEVLILIGSADKENERNPIPVSKRRTQVVLALMEVKLNPRVLVYELDDLKDELNNTESWGEYLYVSIISIIKQLRFTLYYGDEESKVKSWFSKILLDNFINLSMVDRSSIANGISSTELRNKILNNEYVAKYCPTVIHRDRHEIKEYLLKYKK